jgi:hypothetical protein
MNCKKLGHFLIIFITLFNSILLHPEVAWACSCFRDDPVSTEFAASDTVFVGTVTGIIDPLQIPYYFEVMQLYYAFVPPLPNLDYYGFRHQTVIFAVKNAWKGAKTTYLTVRGGAGSGDCGYIFSQGKQYVVYSREWAGNLYTSNCSRTNEITQASEDLSYLQTLPESELTPVMAPQIFCLILVTVIVIALLGVIWGVRQKYRAHSSTELT